jgi:hypothetical protein
MSSAAESVRRAKEEVARLKRNLVQAEADLEHAQKRVRDESAKLREQERAIARERSAWDRAIAGVERKGWKVKAWTVRETAVATGLDPSLVGDIVHSGVWSHRLANMDGYVYSPAKGQLSYPVAYFRRREVLKRIREMRTCLLSVNFRRMLRREPPLTFEEAQKLDRNQGTRWRRL